MFSKILIANRGEIAVRIIKTARRMGIKTVQVYSDADAASLAVEMADEAVHIGPSPAAQSYLLIDRIIAAARESGAEAIHPGFGFLSEKAEFARALAAEKIAFIGPNVRAIEAMGDKIESKKFAAAANVSTVPGHIGEIADPAHAIAIAEEIGYPVMIKASAGGGGKGIRVAWNRLDVEEGFPAVRAEAKGAFGDDRIFIEKFITSPRHIEIQVLGDKHGNVVHLFERECSIQRRNQKVIEEAPSPLLDEATRAAMGAQAVALAKAVDYDSAGTVEFVAGQDKSFYFLEMNTRLQVEHPVTELITGLDLVEQMIRSAAGEKLPFAQKDLKIDGWAVESRIYAEDPYRSFLPSIGRLVRYRPPQEGKHGAYEVRNDAGVREGDEISMFYDPMIAKLCTHAATREAAADGMAEALDDFLVEGVGQNIPFLSAVMDQPRFREGRLSTGYIAEEFPGGFHGLAPSDRQRDLMLAAAVWMHRLQACRRVEGPPPRDAWIVVIGGVERRVEVTQGEAARSHLDPGGAAALPSPLRGGVGGGGEDDARSGAPSSGPIDALTIQLPDEGRALTLDGVDWRPGQHLFHGRLDGAAFTASVKTAAEGFAIRHRAATERVLVLSPRSAELHHKLPPKKAADTSKLIVSPMPGLVVSIAVEPGQEVKAGEGVAVVEAMKMQNIIRAEQDGVVKTVGFKPGDPVAADEVLVELA